MYIYTHTHTICIKSVCSYTVVVYCGRNAIVHLLRLLLDSPQRCCLWRRAGQLYAVYRRGVLSAASEGMLVEMDR